MKTGWSVENFNEAVNKEFDLLPKDAQAKFLRLAGLIEELGLLSIHEPYVKHIEGEIWELRVKSISGISRGLYCTVKNQRIIILCFFQKKTQKLPRSELKIAFERIKLLKGI